ncbi:MAG TPA: hypothetical protein VFT96_06315 [Gemmatimonadaceae bacterium]|nr:hypothetical protein [Gemmatimonadaceae bacterium]
MAHRMFSDASGREWLVWDVIPTSVGRQDEASQQRDIPAALPDRNRRDTPRSSAHLPAALAGGWLCFESGADRRRLGPIPPDWDRLADRELERLLDRADRVGSGERGRLDTAKLRAMSRPSGGHPRM